MTAVTQEPSQLSSASASASAPSAPSSSNSVSIGLTLISLLVPDYDEAIAFFTRSLGFTLTEDTASISTATGEKKRWVVVHPPSSESSGSSTGCGILLAKPSSNSAAQQSLIGNQWGGRVGMFLRVADFENTYRKMKNDEKVRFMADEPRIESYGKVIVFMDPWGNKWDLLGFE